MRSSRTQFLSLLFVCLCATTLLMAGDVPWKGKPYQQWDDSDIQRVFTDSPWARSASITRTWLPITSKDLPNQTISGRDRGLPGTLDHSGESSVGGELEVHVFWASSRVVRAATARKSILHAGKTDLDVDKYASEPQEEYQVVVQSQDMAPFFRHDEKSFEANAFIQMKKSKLKLPPSHVHFEHDEKGLVTSAVFYFPKKTTSGDPTIAPDEKSVDFNCKLEGSNLHVSFEPGKMVDPQGPAL